MVRNVSQDWSLYGNAGWVSKVPIFDGVIDDNAGVLNDDPKNETFLSFEAGARYRSSDRTMSLDANVYHTTWKNRTRNQFVRNLFGDNLDGLVNLLGVNARHMGIEIEGAYQPSPFFRLDAAASIGDWIYTDNVTGQFRPDDRQAETETFEFYIKDLYVGDAPQMQVAYGVLGVPGGRAVRAGGREVLRQALRRVRSVQPDRSGRRGHPVLAAPGYTVFDLHAGTTSDRTSRRSGATTSGCS